MRPRPQLFSTDLYGKLSQTLACLYQSFCHFNTAFKYCVSSVCESFIFFRSITSKRIHPSSLMAKNSPCFATYLLSFLFHKNIKCYKRLFCLCKKTGWTRFYTDSISRPSSSQECRGNNGKLATSHGANTNKDTRYERYKICLHLLMPSTVPNH